MATRKTSVVGQISGKLGNTVTRYRNGKYIVYSKPDNYNISYSDKAVNGRSKFANTVKMAKLLNSVPEISKVWKSAKINGTNAYQKIIKHNSKFISPEGITAKNIITPSGFFISAKEIIFDEDNIVLRCLVEKEFPVMQAQTYMLLSLRISKNEELFVLLSDKIKSIDSEYVELSFSISKYENKKLFSAQKAIVLVAFISLTPQIRWANTISFEYDPPDVIPLEPWQGKHSNKI